MHECFTGHAEALQQQVLRTQQGIHCPAWLCSTCCVDCRKSSAVIRNKVVGARLDLCLPSGCLCSSCVLARSAPKLDFRPQQLKNTNAPEAAHPQGACESCTEQQEDACPVAAPLSSITEWSLHADSPMRLASIKYLKNTRVLLVRYSARTGGQWHAAAFATQPFPLASRMSYPLHTPKSSAWMW